MAKIKDFNKFLNKILAKNISGITLEPFGIYIRKEKQIPSTINHEKIHSIQQKEMLYVFFYIVYFIEWILRSLHRSNAYRRLSFEREAYMNSKNPRYLEFRKPYSWIKYL